MLGSDVGSDSVSDSGYAAAVVGFGGFVAVGGSRAPAVVAAVVHRHQLETHSS